MTNPLETAELVAREMIRDLVARYAHGVDRGCFDEVAALFAVDGVLELPNGSSVTGPAAIRAFLGGVRPATTPAQTSPRPIRHHVSSHQITLDGANAATGFAYFLVMTEHGPDHWGGYADRYVRIDQSWRFARRRVRVDGRAAASWVSARPE